MFPVAGISTVALQQAYKTAAEYPRMWQAQKGREEANMSGEEIPPQAPRDHFSHFLLMAPL